MAFLNSISYRAVRASIGRPAIARLWATRPSLLFSLSITTLIASLLLGGGTRSGFLSDTILEFIAIPALLTALSSLFALPWAGNNRAAEWALMLCLGAVILPLVQLVPLPPWIWTRLPHREQITDVFDLLHRQLPWLPISVAPSLTWAALASLLPPLAIFLGLIQLGYRERRLISLVVVGIGLLSAFLGLLQVAQGPSSPWRFFAVTNASEAVGFFANRNHLASLLYSVLMFGAAWAINAGYSFGSWNESRKFETTSIVMLTGSFLGLVVLIAAEASTRSRAGLGLLIVALFAALGLALSDRRKSSTATPIKLIVASVVVALLLVVQFALFRIVARFEDPLRGARIEIAHNTIAAAEAYMPFGSGFGTFVAVYPNFEPTNDALDNKYVNHAHDDWLEVALEGGAMSLMMLAGFIGWFLLTAANVWRRRAEDVRAIDVLLGRAATLVIPLILVHSVVDYPLRTGGIMAVFVLACGFLIRPLQFMPKEIEPRLAPAVEISEAERRRLARLGGDVAIADTHEGMLAPPEGEPPVEPADFADEAMMLEPSADEHDTPVDLDELAGLLEPAASVRKPANTQKIVRETADQNLADHDDHDPAVSAPQMPATTGRQAPANIAGPPASGKSVGEMAYLLAQVNQLSDVLVTRSDQAGGSPANSAEGGGGLTLAEAAERRFKILHVTRSVHPPGPTGASNRAASAAPVSASVPSRTAADAAGPQSLATNAAERRKQVLRSVERFIQAPNTESDDAAVATDADGNAALTGETAALSAADSDAAARHETSTAESELAEVLQPGQPESESEKLAAMLAAAGERSTSDADESHGELAAEPTIAAAFAVTDAPDVEAGPTTAPRSAAEDALDAQDVEESAEPTSAAGAASTDSPPREEAGDDEIEWPQQWQSGAAPVRKGPEVQAAVASSSVAANDQESEKAEASDTPRPQPQAVRQERPDAPRQKAGQSLAVKPPPAARRPGATGLGEAPAVPESARWGGGIEWPDEWQK